ncbi:MAG: hypothetical protein ACE5HQ_09325 [Gemmatimonadota bacterium]
MTDAPETGPAAPERNRSKREAPEADRDGGPREGAVDLRELRRVPVADRATRVSGSSFARPPASGGSFRDFYEALPHVLAAESFRAVVGALVAARRRRRACVWMLGGHVVKTGLSRVLIDLMERGVVSHVAMNGAAAIHDYEICRWGRTSEDVASGLAEGSFGMARETGRDMNLAIREGVRSGMGLGAALVEDLAGRTDHRCPELSLIRATRERGVSLSVHTAIGAEITHQHPEADGAAIGLGSHRDFLQLAGVLLRLDDGGVVLNIGSAVLLPEVFLKALTVARNLGGGRPRQFTTADFDMIRHYRPRVNVVERPVQTGGGHGYQLTGHHELMIPLLAWAVAGEVEE